MFGSSSRRRKGAGLDGHIDLEVSKPSEGYRLMHGKKVGIPAEGIDRSITLRERLKHFTWAWFTLPMSTGGLATLLSVQPHTFYHLSTLGTIVYILDLTIFLVLCGCITSRFLITRTALKNSLSFSNESLFFGTFWLCLPTIIGGMNNYGVSNVGPWLIVVLRILFWIYCACTICVAIGQYWYLFTARQMTLNSMMPSWILPIFPVMLCGTLASIIASNQPPDQRMPIIVAGVTFQGLGIMVSFMIYVIMMHRLMEFGLPNPNLRPGLFICVGPPSFTALALIGMSNALPTDYGYFAEYPLAIVALKAVALFMAIFLWALSFWWFCIALISCLAVARDMTFHLVWWSFVFPNVGFTIATINIGEQLESQGVQWVGSIMTIFVFITWVVVLANHIRALVTKRMMMPGMDEDKDEYDDEDSKLN